MQVSDWTRNINRATFLFQSAATCYIELIVKESDNNVKLIVLDRLIALKDNPAHEKVLQVQENLALIIIRTATGHGF